MKNVWFSVLVLVAVVTISAYLFVRPSANDERIPSVVRIGVLPYESEEILDRRYTPLLQYLSESTGLETRLVIASNYNEMVRLFGNGELELACFGGFTFVQAQAAYGAEPLVMRDVDARFTSWFLVRGDDPATTLSDLKGRSFSFGSKLSTSGHLMPRHFLTTEFQLVPEEVFVGVRYSGAHDQTAYDVRDGVVDAGAANSQVVRQMLLDGRLQESDVRILWQTPPFVDNIWSVSGNLHASIKTRLRDAFLDLDANDPAYADLMAPSGAQAFLPAGVGDVAKLTRVVESLGLLEVQ